MLRRILFLFIVVAALAFFIEAQQGSRSSPKTLQTHKRGSRHKPAEPPVRSFVSDSGGRELIVRLLDVGQGDATYIRNGTSKVIIDGGPDSAAFGRYLDSLRLNNSTIDLVILTHQHLDHYSGLRALFETRRHIHVHYFFENKDPATAVTLAHLRDSILSRIDRDSLIYRDTDDPCSNGQPICTITMTGGAKLHILAPQPDGTGANNRSAVVKLVGPDSASFTMWLAGDAEHEEINWFELAGYDLNPGMSVSVLKADHHGSCNGVMLRYLSLTHNGSPSPWECATNTATCTPRPNRFTGAPASPGIAPIGTEPSPSDRPAHQTAVTPLSPPAPAPISTPLAIATPINSIAPISS